MRHGSSRKLAGGRGGPGVRKSLQASREQQRKDEDERNRQQMGSTTAIRIMKMVNLPSPARNPDARGSDNPWEKETGCVESLVGQLRWFTCPRRSTPTLLSIVGENLLRRWTNKLLIEAISLCRPSWPFRKAPSFRFDFNSDLWIFSALTGPGVTQAPPSPTLSVTDCEKGPLTPQPVTPPRPGLAWRKDLGDHLFLWSIVSEVAPLASFCFSLLCGCLLLPLHLKRKVLQKIVPPTRMSCTASAGGGWWLWEEVGVFFFLGFSCLFNVGYRFGKGSPMTTGTMSTRHGGPIGSCWIGNAIACTLGKLGTFLGSAGWEDGAQFLFGMCVCVLRRAFLRHHFMSGGGPPTNRLIQPNGGRLASEFFFISSLSSRVCFCVIVQVIDARSNGNGANKMWHWSRRFVCVCSYVCVCMRVFLLMVQVPHEIRNVILDFGPTLGCFFCAH